MDNKYWILLVLIPRFMEFCIFLWVSHKNKKEFNNRMDYLEDQHAPLNTFGYMDDQ